MQVVILKMLRIFVLQFIKVPIIGMTIAILTFGASHTILINYETDYLSNLLHEFRKSEASGTFTTIVGSKLVHNRLA